MLVQKITLFCVQEEMNQDHDGESYVINMVAKWRIFVLNKVRVWWPRRHTSFQNSVQYSPPAPPPPHPTSFPSPPPPTTD